MRLLAVRAHAEAAHGEDAYLVQRSLGLFLLRNDRVSHAPVFSLPLASCQGYILCRRGPRRRRAPWRRDLQWTETWRAAARREKLPISLQLSSMFPGSFTTSFGFGFAVYVRVGRGKRAIAQRFVALQKLCTDQGGAAVQSRDCAGTQTALLKSFLVAGGCWTLGKSVCLAARSGKSFGR